MPDSTKKTGKQDRVRVASSQDHEVKYAAKTMGATAAQVKKAAQEAGPLRENVRKAVRKAGA